MKNNQSILSQIKMVSFVSTIFFALLLLSGCGAITSQNVPEAFQVRNTINAPTPPPGSALVVIRWPVAMDDKAQSVFDSTWFSGHDADASARSTALMAMQGFAMLISLGSKNLIDEVQNNKAVYKQIPEASTYYAMELYRQLLKYIPETQIILEPQLLTALSGSFKSIPLTEGKLPVVFAVDILHIPNISVDPYFLPYFTIATSGLASPKTCGAVASSINYNNKVEAFMEKECLDLTARNSRKPEYLDHFYSKNEGINKFSEVPLREQLPLTSNQLMLFPMIGETFSPEYLAQSASPSFDSSKLPLQNQTIEILVKALADGISHYDLKKATQAGLAEYVSGYDKPLSDGLKSGATLSEQEQANFAVVTQLADMEKQWITKQDKLVADNILDGAFGKSFRATRLAYLEMQNQRQQASMAQLDSLAMSTINSGALTGNFNSLAMMSNALQREIQYQSKLSEIGSPAIVMIYEKSSLEEL